MQRFKWIKRIGIPKATYKFRFFAAALACYLSILAIISFLIFPKVESKFEVGGVAFKDYASPYELTFVNTIKTETLKSSARNAIQPVLITNEGVNNQYRINLANFLQTLERGKVVDESLEGPFEEDFFKDISDQERNIHIQKTGLSDEEYKRLTQLSDAEIADFISQLTESQNRILARHISEANIDMIREDTANRLRATLHDKTLVSIAGTILNSFSGINTFVDNDATENARIDAEERVEPIMETIHKDEIFLRNGEVINDRHLNILNTLYEPETRKAARARIRKIITMACLTLAAFVIYWYFLGILSRNPLVDLRLYYMFLLQAVVTIMLGYIIARLFPGVGLPYLLLIPLVTNAWIVTYFVSVEASLLSTLFIGAFFALSFSLDQTFLLSSMITGAISSFLIKRDCRHAEIIRGSLFLILIGTLSIISASVVFDEPLKKIYTHLQYNFYASIIAPFLMLGLSMIYVQVFNIITRYHLIDLSDVNRPLIRQLQRESPGSYHHSLMVGDIGEIAADAIGANGLLVRVACLYHDIGKAKMPHFYIENQSRGQNPHDRYPPSLSRLVVLSHVKDGVLMAKKARLPDEIIDAISQHHGTTMMKYFYRKALAQSNGNPIDEFDYRYDGPKPQYPEMAIIALADSAEGAVRSLDEPTPHRIETMIDELFYERLLDGQFDECGMSVSSLQIVKESLIETLSGIYHSRIEYPDVKELKSQFEKQKSDDENSVE